jgi:hypothetical protein
MEEIMGKQDCQNETCSDFCVTTQRRFFPGGGNCALPLTLSNNLSKNNNKSAVSTALGVK